MQYSSTSIKNFPLVSIAFHIGTEKNILLYENLIKSFLVCNRYPKIELILIESGGSQKIRKWISDIDFDDYFIDADGRETTIKKHDLTSIKKVHLFVDGNDSSNKDWNSINRLVMGAINESILKSTGEYYVCLHEDNQFTVKGDLISDFIDVVNLCGSSNTQLHFFSQQGYKYAKKNNEFFISKNAHEKAPYQIKEMKYCPFSFTGKRFYENIGLIQILKEDISHQPIERMTLKCRSTSCKRYYPVIPGGVWIANDDIAKVIEIIKNKRKENVDYIAMEIFEKENLMQIAERLRHPFSSEFFMNRFN